MELEGTDILEYDIHVKQDTRPMRQKPYNYSEKARANIKKQVQELLEIKLIRRSTSPWCSNVLLVKKHNKSMRMCVDYRQLNSCIVPEVHPVLTYTAIADTLSYAKPKIYSSIDLRSSFDNLKIKECCMSTQPFKHTLDSSSTCAVLWDTEHPKHPLLPHVTHSF